MQRLLSSKTSNLLSAFRFSTTKLKETALFSNSFLNSANVNYLENQYSKWASDPSSVAPSFATFFNSLSTRRTKTTPSDPNVQFLL